MNRTQIKRILKSVFFVFYVVAAVEFIGLICVITLRYTGNNIPQGIQWMFPHPIFAHQPDSRTRDPNTVWYMQHYRFGKKREIPPAKRPGEFRVFILGGSTVEGDGATTEQESIASVLEQTLSKSKTFSCGPVRVFNEGVSSFGSKQELLSVALRIVPFQSPDAIIALDGVNEFLNGIRTDTDMAKRYNLAQYWHPSESALIRALEKLDTVLGAAFQTLHVLARKFLTRTFIGSAINYGYSALVSREPDRPGYPLVDRLMGVGSIDWRHVPSLRDDLIDYYFSNIQMMGALAKVQQADFLWALQPVLLYKKAPTPNETAFLTDRHFGPEFWAKFREFYEKARSRIRPEQEHWIDMSAFLADSADNDFVDFVHYTPVAQRKIGEALARTLEERIRKSGHCRR